MIAADGRVLRMLFPINNPKDSRFSSPDKAAAMLRLKRLETSVLRVPCLPGFVAAQLNLLPEVDGILIEDSYEVKGLYRVSLS